MKKIIALIVISFLSTIAGGDTVYRLDGNDTAASSFWSGSSGANLNTLLGAMSSSSMQLPQVFTSSARAATVPRVVGQIGWESDTGKFYRGTATSAGSWTLATAASTAININTAGWVESDGSDSTGVVGDPAHPYLTMSAAYDAGVRVFYLGNGTFAGLSKAGSISIRIAGLGRSHTRITLIKSTNDQGVEITDLNSRSVYILTIGGTSSNALAEEQAGIDGSPINLEAVSAVNVISSGGIGGDSSNNVNAPGQGGAGGIVSFSKGCEIGSLVCGGGKGGDSSFSTTIGGTGGPGGQVTITGDSEIGNIIANGGVGGDGGGSAPGGTGGNGGTVSSTRSTIGEVEINPGAGGAGGFFGIEGSSTGALFYYSTVASLHMADGSSAGTVFADFSKIEGINEGSPMIQAIFSRINGTNY